MSAVGLDRRLVAEALGTGVLVATVVGSGIMAEKLAGGNVALALLGNTIPTGAILVVLVTILGPVSGAHLNPAVSLVMALRRALPTGEVAPFVLAQVAGGLAGTWLAHAMFGLPLWQLGVAERTGVGQWLGEFVATAGLVLVILGCVRHRPEAVPWAVGLYITAAYWFTSSTSFANPAVTIARAVSGTFAGIRVGDVPAFLAAQLLGAVVAARLGGCSPRPQRRNHLPATMPSIKAVPALRHRISLACHEPRRAVADQAGPRARGPLQRGCTRRCWVTNPGP